MMKQFATLLGFCLCAFTAYAGDWLQWRGPHYNGIADGDAPTVWSDTKNVAWKAAIPGRGHSTPIVVGNRIFLTTAIPVGKGATGAAAPAGEARRRGAPRGAAENPEHRFVTMALDRKTGKVLWEKTATSATPHEGYHNRYGSFASHAPVSDGKHVWAMFGSRGLYCYDLDGNLKWKKDLPAMRMRSTFGEGGSPVLAGSRLILSLDQESNSTIMVLDKDSGKEIWKKDRDEASSWATPLVIKAGGRDQVIVPATNRVRAYDLENGAVIWECGGLGSNVIPSPVVEGNLLAVMSGHRDPKLMVIRLGGKGDLTGSGAVVWTIDRGTSYTPSPVVQDGKLYFVTDRGMLNCFDLATGKPYYHQQRLPNPYTLKASLTAANGKLYVATEEGDVLVVKMGGTFEVLATNTLEDQFFIASPVIVDGEIFLRGQQTLFCIRER